MVTCSDTLLQNYLPLETHVSPPESGLFYFHTALISISEKSPASRPHQSHCVAYGFSSLVTSWAFFYGPFDQTE